MVPRLVAELDKTSDPPICGWIPNAFREMGPAAKPAVPAILKKVQLQRGVSSVHGIDISSAGLKALENIDPEAAAKAAVK